MIIEDRQVFCNRIKCIHNENNGDCTAKILEIGVEGCLEFIERRSDG